MSSAMTILAETNKLRMNQDKQMKLMKVLEQTEAIMNDKYDYEWEDSDTLEVKPEYQEEYDHIYNIFFEQIVYEADNK